ncbi:MAG: class I SAM-dependent methyltransferase [Burkholderiales bacterium]
MVDTAANFSGSMPEYYDRIMGPGQFDVFAPDLVARVPAKPPGVRLVATDISKPMLEHARAKLAGVQGIEWREADAAALPFADASFGAVVCAFGVMFVPDKKRLFGEARRVLAEGGLLLFNVWDGLDASPASRATNGVFEQMFPGDPEMRFGLPFEFNDRGVLRSLLGGARFGEKRMEPVRLEVRFPSARELATGQLRGTPRGALLEKRGLALDAIIEKCAAELAKVGGAAPFRSSAQALVVEAVAV